jgi:transcriptional regulator with XRE-family HTH domain
MGKRFGEHLKKLRENRGLTLRDVEKDARVSNAYLSQVERGERGIPNFKVLSKLAQTYGVPVTSLMEVAEAESKHGKISDDVKSPDVQFVSRGYEKLSDEKKNTLKSFLQHLVSEEEKERKK